MPRRARPGEYYKEGHYEVERETYTRPRRSRREHVVEEDVSYGRRMSVPVPIEELGRLHIRDRSNSELHRHRFDPPRDPGPRAARSERAHFDVPSSRGMSRGSERAMEGIYERRERSHHRKLRKEEDESDTETGSEEDDIYIRKKERVKPRSDYDSEDEELLQHERRSRCGRKVRMPKDERDVSYHRTDEVRRGHSRSQNMPSPSHSKSHRHTDGDEEELDEIVTRRVARRHQRRGKYAENEEIITWNRGRPSSPESASSSELPPARVPPIHADFHTPNRHMPGEYIIAPPPAPSPELSSAESSFEELEIRHSSKGGRPSHEHILIERTDDPRPPSRHPSPEPNIRRKKDNITIAHIKPRSLDSEDFLVLEYERHREDTGQEREIIEEEHDIHRDLGSLYHEASPKDTVGDLAIVRAGSKTRIARRNGSSDQEIMRQRHKTGRRSKSITSSELVSSDDTDHKHGHIGRRYIGVKDNRDRLWTEVTKDLVVKEAIERAGYEYDETESSYYIFSYLQRDEISALIQLSEDVRCARRRRIQEIHRERASLRLPPVVPATPIAPAPVILEMPPSPRLRPRDERRMKERKLVNEGNHRRPTPTRSGRW